MSHLFERNLAALAKVDAGLASLIETVQPSGDIEVFPARSGQMTMTLSGVSLHSRFDPVKEAIAWAGSAEVKKAIESGEKVAIFGMGLGYHVIELSKYVDEIWIIELNLYIIKQTLTCQNFSQIMNKINFVTEEAGNCPASILLAHPPSQRMNPDGFEYWSMRINYRETGIEFMENLKGLSGAEKLIGKTNPEEIIDLKSITEMIKTGRGPMSAPEIYTLLINELS